MKKSLLSLLFFCVASVEAQSPVTASATAVSNSGAGASWNISTTTITVNTPSQNFSAFLQGINFGFAIPASAVIDGIVLKSQMFTANGSHNDTLVQLLKNAGPTGQNKNGPGNIFAGQLTYGSATDLWGASWTPSDINNSNFGFQFRVFNPSPNTNLLFFSGQFSLTVYYTTSTGISSSQTKADDFISAETFHGGVSVKSHAGSAMDRSQFTILNLAGQEIYRQQLHFENPEDEVKICLPELSKGIYILTVDKENLHYSRKVFME